MTHLPRIAVIVTGGTIDAVAAKRLELANYGLRNLDAEELVALAPEAAEFCRAEPVTCDRLGTVSWDVNLGMGGGRPGPVLEDAVIAALENGINVVQCSRCTTGTVIPSERLPLHGLIAAGRLNAFKARLLLMLAMDAGVRRSRVAELFR